MTNTNILPSYYHFYNHGICKQLCTGRLRAGPEEEEPRPPGSDWKVLWRGQEEEEQGEEAGRVEVKTRPFSSISVHSADSLPEPLFTFDSLIDPVRIFVIVLCFTVLLMVNQSLTLS